MSTHTDPPARRALALAALTSACLVAALGLATDQASADYTARVQAGTLQITGDGAGDTLTLAQAARPTTLDVVVNGQLARPSTAPRSPRSRVDAGGGDDRSASRTGPRRRERHDRRRRRQRHAASAATAPRRSSAAPATTSSTATSAPTPRSSAPATTPSSGIPATAATPSKARAASDALALQRLQHRRGDRRRRQRLARAPDPQRRRHHDGPRRHRARRTSAPSAAPTT